MATYQERLQKSLGLLGQIKGPAARSTPYQQSFAAQSVSDWNRNKAAYSAGALEGVDQPEDGWDKFWRPIEGVLNALSAGGSGTTNMIDKQAKAAADVAKSGDWGSIASQALASQLGGVFVPTSPIRQFWDGFFASWNSDTKSENYMTGSKMIESVTDTIGTARNEVHGEHYEDVQDNVNPWVKGGFGFVADVALDPLTYVPGGVFASGARGAVRAAKTVDGLMKIPAAAKGVVKGTPDAYAIGRWSKAPKPVGLEQWTQIRQYNKVDRAARRAGLNTPDILDIVDEMAAGAGRESLERVLRESGKDESEVMDLITSVKDQIPAARTIFDGVFELPGAANLGMRKSPALANVGEQGISRYKYGADEADDEAELPDWAKSQEALDRHNSEYLADQAARQAATAARVAPTPDSQLDDAVERAGVESELAAGGEPLLKGEYDETLARAARETAENTRARGVDDAARALDDETVTGIPWSRETSAHARSSRRARQLRAAQGTRAVQARRLLEGGEVRQLLRMENTARDLNKSRLRYRAVDGEIQPVASRLLPKFNEPQRNFLAAQEGVLPPHSKTQSGKILFDRSSPEYTEWSDLVNAGTGAARRTRGASKPVAQELSEAFQRNVNAGMTPEDAWSKALTDQINANSVLLRRPQDYGEAIGDVLEGAPKQAGIVALWRWMSHADKRAYDETQLAEIAERLGVSILDIPAEQPFIKYLREAGSKLYSRVTQATQSRLEAVRNATVIGGNKIQALSKVQSPAAGIRDLYDAHTAELAAFLGAKGVPAEGIEVLARDIQDEAAAIVVESTRYSMRRDGNVFDSDAGYETSVFPNEHVTTGEQAVHTRVINQRSEATAARLARTWVDTRFGEFSDTSRMQILQHVLGEVQLQMQRFGMVARAEINSRVTNKFINEVDDAADLANLARQWSFLSVPDVMRALDLDLITDLFYSSRNKVDDSEWSFPPSVLAEAGTMALKLREAKVPVAGKLTEFRPLSQGEAADILSAFIHESVRVATKQDSLFVKNWVAPQRELAESLMDQLAVALTNQKTLVRLEQANARNGAIAYSFGKAGANTITAPVKEAIDRVVTMAGNGLHNGKVAAEFNKAVDQLRRALAKEAEATGLTKQDLEWMISEADVYRYAALHMTPAAAAFTRFQGRMQNATMRAGDGSRIPESKIDEHADRIAGKTPPATETRKRMLREAQVAAQRERVAQNAELTHHAAEQRLEEIARTQDPMEQAEAAREAPQALLSDTLRLQEQTLRGTQGVEADAVAELEHRTAKAANDAAAAERAASTEIPQSRDDIVTLYGDRRVTPEQAAKMEQAVWAYRANAGNLSPTRQVAAERKRAQEALRQARLEDGTLPIAGRTQAIWLAKVYGELAGKKVRYSQLMKLFREENLGGWTTRDLDVLVSRGLATYVTDAKGTRVGLEATGPADKAGEVMSQLVRDPHILDEADLADDVIDAEDAQRVFDGANTQPVAADSASARRDERPVLSDRERNLAQGAQEAAEAAAKAQADEAALGAERETQLLTGEGMVEDPGAVSLNARDVTRRQKWAERLSGQAGVGDVKSDLALRQIRAQDVSSNYEHFLERDVVQALMREQNMTLQQAADLTDTWFLQYARAKTDEDALKWLEQFAGTPMEVIAGNFHKAMSILFQHSAWTSIWARAGLNSDHIRKAIKLSPLGATPAAWVPSGLTGWEMAKFWTQQDSFLRFIGGDAAAGQFRAIDLLKGYNWALHHASITPNIAADLINKFGHEAFGFPKNWSARDARAAGFVKFESKGGLGEWLDGIDVYFPEQMKAQFESVERFVDYVRTLPQNEVGKLIRVTDKVTGAIKSSLTLWRPGHHVVNVMGEALMNLLVGVTNPARYAHSIAVMRAGGEWKRGTVFGHNGLKDIELFAAEYGLDEAADTAGRTLKMRIGGKTREVTYAQAYQFLDRAGLLINHNTAEDIVSIADDVMHANGRFDGKFGLIVRANRGLGEFSARRDNVFRVAHALDILDKRGFRSWEEAADTIRKEVFEAHPTMQTLSGFEQKVMRRVFYFYTWQRQALTMVLKSILERPGMLTIPAKANYEASVALGGEPQSIGQPMPDDPNVPSFLAGNILGPHWYDEEGNLHSLSINAPQLDILQSFFGNMKFNPDQDLASNMRDNGFEFLRENTIGMASPILKAPAELLSGTQFRGSGLSQPIDDAWDYTADQTGLGYISRVTGRNLYNNDGWFGYRADVLDDKSPEDQEFRQGTTVNNWFTGLRYQQPSRYATSAENERKREDQRMLEDAERNWLGNSPERVVDPATGAYQK